MFLCDTLASGREAFDDLIVFASQARATGLLPAIHEKSMTDDLSDAARYGLQPFLTSLPPPEAERLILLGADGLTDAGMRRIRRLSAGAPLDAIAFGRFPTRQARIGVAAKLAYALGRDPEIVDLPDNPGFPSPPAPLFAAPSAPLRRPRPVVVPVFPEVTSADHVAAVRGLVMFRDIELELITNGRTKPEWRRTLGPDVPVWHPGEILPRSLAARIDVALLCAPPSGWYRVQALVANLAARGAALIDATPDRSWSGVVDGVIPGTFDPPLLGAGVGLGHAKRCSIIAAELKAPRRAVFAAFPSCLELLNRAGFDAMPLIGRSPHRGAIENDLVSHARLRSLTRGARGLVFDGGYVFDSVVQTVAERQLRAVWVRRGLWQDNQNNEVARDRQKVFDRIVVPAEAFDELNAPARAACRVVEVGPIVQPIRHDPAARDRLRAAVGVQVGRPAEQLVVTMLGGGVAADRRAHTTAIAAHLAGRTGLLHLIVVWPTSVADPAWFAFENTRVVQTHHAGALVSAADLFISAAGYNSFHEALYGGIPTIFVPQMAPFMDDQRARAISAAERGVALLTEPWEILRLTQLIDECLEGRQTELRSALDRLNLPEPGGAAAARAIEEVMA